MKTKGLDNGYLNTKDDEGRIFKSAISQDKVMSSLEITIDDEHYNVGTGDTIITQNKIKSTINKVCILTNLALTGEDDYYLVVGLPIEQFKEQRDSFKETILSYNDSKVIWKNEEFKFSIKDVIVFPQGVGSVLSIEEKIYGDIIIVDMGGLTIDIAYMNIKNNNPTILKSMTIYDGIQRIYPDIMRKVHELGLLYDDNYAETIFINGGLYDNEKIYELAYFNDILNSFIEPFIKKTLNFHFPARSTPIYLCGGSSKIFYDIFKKHYHEDRLHLIPNPQFSNAKGYYKVGLKKFGHLLNDKVDIPIASSIPPPVNSFHAQKAMLYRR